MQGGLSFAGRDIQIAPAGVAAPAGAHPKKPYRRFVMSSDNSTTNEKIESFRDAWRGASENPDSLNANNDALKAAWELFEHLEGN